MSLSIARKTANSIVSHVHFASITTQFNTSFNKDAGQYVLFCMNDDKKSTAEFFVHDLETLGMVTNDLTKLGYTQF